LRGSVASLHAYVQQTQVHPAFLVHMTRVNIYKPKLGESQVTPLETIMFKRDLLPRSKYEHNMLITVPPQIQQHPAMPTLKPPRKDHHTQEPDHAPMPEPRTENTGNLAAGRPLMQRTQIIKVVSSLQTWRIRSLEKRKNVTVRKEILFVPDGKPHSVWAAVRRWMEKGQNCSELGRCIWSSQTGEEVLSFLQFS